MIKVRPQREGFKNEITIKLEGMGPIHSEEAERALLGAILSQSEQVMMHCQEQELSAEHFFNPAHKQLYAAIEDMERKRTPIDLSTVMQWLDDRKLSNATGGPGLLGDLAAGVVTVMTAPAHIHTILSKARLRKIFDAGAKMAYDAHERQHEVNDVVDRAERSIIEITTLHGKSEVTQFRKDLTAAFTTATRKKIVGGELLGPGSGWTRLDHIMMGFRPKSMVVIGGRQNQGKTNLCLSWMRNWGYSGIPCGGISLETDKESLSMRMLSMHSGQSYTKMQKGWLNKAEEEVLSESAMEMEDWPIYFHDKGQETLSGVKTAIRVMVRKYGCRIIWVDHVGLIKVPEAGHESEAVTIASKELSALRKELGICIIVLSQTKKVKDDNVNRRPTRDDLYYGNQLVSDADVIFMIHREIADNGRPMPTGKLYGEKGRDIEIDDVEIEVNSSTMLVEELQMKAL